MLQACCCAGVLALGTVQVADAAKAKAKVFTLTSSAFKDGGTPGGEERRQQQVEPELRRRERVAAAVVDECSPRAPRASRC